MTLRYPLSLSCGVAAQRHTMIRTEPVVRMYAAISIPSKYETCSLVSYPPYETY